MIPRRIRPYLIALLLAFVVAALVFPLTGGAAPGSNANVRAQSQQAQDPARPLPDYDAFGASRGRAGAGADAAAQSPAQQQQVEAGHAVQYEPRLGVPTFLWASQKGQARAFKGLSAQQHDADAASAAKEHLADYASWYRLSAGDIAEARVAQIHDTGTGPVIVKLRREVGGVEVFRDEINVVMDRNLQLIALSGYLTGDEAGAGSSPQDFKLRPADALSRALADLTGAALSPSVFKDAGPGADPQSPYLRFTADRGDTPNFTFTEEPARVKQVMYHLPDGYVPAYYVEADIYVPSTRADVVSVTGEPPQDELAYAYVISAVDGQLLFRGSQIASDFTYRVWADPTTKIPYDTPAGNGPHPKVTAAPDGFQAPFVSTNDVALLNYPFSQNDPWLAPGATSTNGNNVEAYVNLVNAAGNNDNGFGPAAEPPADPPSGDHHAFTTAADQFLHTTQPDVDAYSADARQASITQLFYDINFLHDWFYDAGFNEAAGNAQTNNFGRGGLGSDSIKAQAQDTQSFSNANMLTPADGGRPRMRMYNFPNPANTLDIQAPAAIQGKVNIGISQTGKRDFDVTNDIVIATFSNSPSACTVTNAAALAGRIAMFDFDNTDGTGCAFSTRITRIHATSAAAALMV